MHHGEALRGANHDLACWAHRFLCEQWEVEAISPLDGSMLGSIATVRLPPWIRSGFDEAMAFQGELYDRHRIEVPVMDWGDEWFIRVSAQAYNTADDYQTLAEAVLASRR